MTRCMWGIGAGASTSCARATGPRCGRHTACDRECSEREGTLMARSKLPEATVERLLQCQRWGVCDEGTADICDVEIKTVHRFQRVAAHRAETHHRQSVQHVTVEGVQLDEAHS